VIKADQVSALQIFEPQFWPSAVFPLEDSMLARTRRCESVALLLVLLSVASADCAHGQFASLALKARIGWSGFAVFRQNGLALCAIPAAALMAAASVTLVSLVAAISSRETDLTVERIW